VIQFTILTGRKAGVSWAARRFPVRIGRSASADLQLDEEGVWDEHVEVHFRPRDGFYLETLAEALASVNGQPAQEARLRNGDEVSLGAIKLQFWLGQTEQASLRLREAFTWAAIAALCLGQVALIYWLQV
jgi:predicted component of type VI protein secretion system